MSSSYLKLTDTLLVKKDFIEIIKIKPLNDHFQFTIYVNDSTINNIIPEQSQQLIDFINNNTMPDFLRLSTDILVNKDKINYIDLQTDYIKINFQKNILKINNTDEEFFEIQQILIDYMKGFEPNEINPIK